jgi:hypothetical protein
MYVILANGQEVGIARTLPLAQDLAVRYIAMLGKDGVNVKIHKAKGQETLALRKREKAYSKRCEYLK